ncbi:type II CRISPR RNA-guided endonuclease Cas9 [Alkalitalea saponilacus]|uniref:CRISPR-associated endonuclease Cas9 n=1 Tax=Alkalitalea saponilacus TaxID=889453 RepID=A0A1T5HTT8_9BACT|nr:type II CRISPR RNA-guided endonuclease Cas9 [Alkalitalea saponilacus]ASB48498.1 type II CRISPR RNA-guided endonuclease Cas9 [Alkalitalea saponilacus]SKC24084.1 CRISPR-associated endonuclease Csn1 [Alkalitalea saponilacus]
MKKILGLDLGTNSIGWALVEGNFENRNGNILGLGSRIIPMSQDIIGDFGKGNSVSQTAERTAYRSVRRLRERHLLRRERLHRVLNILNFLPEHYAKQIDFEKKLGQFIPSTEPKLAFNTNRFIFTDSFNEMVEDFRNKQPDLLITENGKPKLIPYDWTIYFLRKKALTQKIKKEELAWIILNFNQKRGYYQLRGEEEEENKNKLVEFYSLKVIDVVADEKPNSKGEIWYSLHLENGWIYRRSSKTPLDDWKNKTRDFIVTTDLNDDGSVKTDKEGAEKRSFRAPKEDDWTLLKKKTEKEINNSSETVGSYIYENLLNDPFKKIKGDLVRTIERKFYKKELELILNTQKDFHPELKNESLYFDSIRELYRNNEGHQLNLKKKNFVHLILEDIIFYQRPLRSQKSSISNCPLEYRTYKQNGEILKKHLKAIPKSHPIYQEFRVWQWMYNLKIYRKQDDSDVTNLFIKSTEDYENLFDFLMQQKEIDHKAVLKYFLNAEGLKGKSLNSEIAKYRWNYVYDSVKDESKKYPCNETGYDIRSRLKKVDGISPDFLTKEKEISLWHIIYSVTDKKDYEKALKSYAIKNELDIESFVEAFIKFPPFKSDYGSYSEKAIKRLLPLMRIGKYWEWDNIDIKTRDRINKFITGEYDENIKDKVREKAIKLEKEDDFQGLQLWLAGYVVYDRHSEAGEIIKWNSVAEMDEFINNFKQHSLRNPIVEQVVTETLRVVRDIWQHYGNGENDFFKEIHVELGRDLKNNADERKRLTNIVSENENTNQRIKALLIEMMNDGSIENVRPYSPVQQEILKIYEDGVLNSDIEIEDDIQKISKKAEPTKAELQRYKLWLEQKYRSPYTGQIIPLNKLFTPEYEIEHVIPQSRYFDDGFTNKVICEAAVNKLKDNQLGLEFIKNHYGQKVSTGFGKEVEVFTESQYKEFVDKHYAKSPGKRNKLLLEEIPEKMIERQLNDSRYISKYICSILSNIVRKENNDDGINSKNLLPGNGKVTTRLKQDWGLNDVWNELILPRFERMNSITKSELFTTYSKNHQKKLPSVPYEYSKGFNKKRIDHRHHAVDALVIASATRDHINLLSNKHAKSKERFDLNRKLRNYEKRVFTRDGERVEKEVPVNFIKPWPNFTADAKTSLEKMVVSFKLNQRIINKATNRYQKWVIKNGKKTKEMVEQEGQNWAVRKPMHKETVSGKVLLSNVKVPKDKILTATRKSIDPSFNHKTIKSITDKGIQNILANYLKSRDNNSELAFSPEGLEELNNNIRQYNNGKHHHPIYKARVYEVGSKFRLGENGNKKDKYVEAAKGTNLFFAVYEDENGKRNYETIPLNEVIEHQKWRATLTKEEQAETPMIPVKNDRGKFLFSLSPNDLVYVPDEEENINILELKNPSKEQAERIYKMVSSSGYQCFFIKHEVANSIVNKLEYSTLNKMERDVNGIMIKEKCIKLNVNRLGNIL